MSPAVIGAIDIGSNSVRLLVVDDGGKTLLRRSAISGLARGLRRSELHLESVTRTAAAVHGLVQEALNAGYVLTASNTHIVTTAAARSAVNSGILLTAVHGAVGIVAEIISGHEEARLSWCGATGVAASNALETNALVDIGGASTEFAVGSDDQTAQATWSVDIGCVRATETFLRSDPPRAEELSGLISVMNAHLEDVEREVPAVRRARNWVGSGGSILTVAAVEIGRYNHDELHGFWLSRAAAEDVFRTVAQERAADRAWNPGLPEDRVGTIVAGAGLLVSIMRFFEMDGITVSVTDLLDAVANELRSRL